MKRSLFFTLSFLLVIACSTPAVKKAAKPVAPAQKQSKADPDCGKKLLLSLREGNGDEAKKLLTENCDVNYRSQRGNTPLMWAAKAGDPTIVSALIEKGADVNALDGYSSEPVLMWAVKKGHLEATRMMVEAGSKVNAADQYGTTPLMDAARYGHENIVKLLLKNGAKINNSTENGETALLYAAGNGHFEIVRLLVSEGANINAITSDTSETALGKAKKSGFDDIVKFISSAGEEEGTPMKREYRRGDTEKIGEIPSMDRLERAWAGKNLPSALSSRDINRQMNSYLTKINRCYNRRLDAGDKNLFGEMRLDIRIAGNGEVLDVMIMDEKYQSTYFGDCIVSAIKSRNFKMFKEEQMNFFYSYTF